MIWKNTPVLVTGGTGFVGSHLVEALSNHGARVISTFQTIQPQSYFAHKHLEKKTILSQTDVTDWTALHHLITQYGVEYIFHLAAQPLVEVAYHNPHHTLQTNVMGTVNVLESSRVYPRIKAVIVASSDKAYGKLEQKKYQETNALKGDHPYEVSKSAADLITLAYAQTYQVPAIVTRFGNIYGEGDLNYSRIIPGIMKALVTGETLELRSDGTFIRDYLHVTDVVAGYLALAEGASTLTNQAFNFGTQDTHSVMDLIKIAQKVLKQKVKYVINNTAQNEIPYQSLDYSKVSAAVGWRPRVSLEKSLPAIFKYYQKII